MSVPAQVSELVARWQEERRQGRSVPAEQLCSDHPELLPEVNRQIQVLAEMESLLGMTSSTAGDPPKGTGECPVIPGYEILQEIGRGGMGVVYKAHHLGLKRLVALKMILACSHASVAELARFQREAEAVARLQHPGIVQIHELGEVDGKPFFALEFLSGGSLADHILAMPLAAAEAAALTEKLAVAIQAAHQAGVIHRDLKPANVLLTKDGSPKITDFGLAKKLDEDMGQTATGAIMGTPSYMAPEQTRGRTAEIGPLTDVYALGAILYELLTGRPPFRGASLLDTLEQVRTQEPVPPTNLQPKTPRDLNTICLKCLQKEPAKRYASAQALAEDLRRFLNGEPISARPVSAWERGRKWVRRRPTVAALMAVSMTAALTLIIGGAIYSYRLQLARNELLKINGDLVLANAAEKKAREDAVAREKEVTLLNGNLVLANAAEKKAREDAFEQTRLAKMEWHRAEDALATSKLRHYASQISLAQQELAAHRSREAWFHLENIPRELRAWEYDHLHAFFERNQTIFRGHTHPAIAVAFSPDGRLLASAGHDKTVRLWDVDNRLAPLVLQGHTSAVSSLTFSPDGKRLASASSDNTVRLWPVDRTQGPPIVKTHTSPVSVVVFSPDGKRLASASHTGMVWLWDLETDQKPIILKGRHTARVWAVAFSPDGKRLASASEDKTVRLWDVDKEQPSLVLEGHTDRVFAVAFSPDGQKLASASGDDTVRLWGLDKERVPLILKGHFNDLSSALAFSPDGKRLANGAYEGAVRLWDLETKKDALFFMGHTKKVVAVAFSSDGKRIASASDDTTVRLWDVDKGQEPLALTGHTRGQINPLSVADDVVAFSPDGKRLAACAAGDTTVRLWDVVKGEGPRVLKGHTSAISAVTFSPDGKRIASASHDRTVRLWNGDQDKALLVLKGHTGRIATVTFSPDGKRIASASFDGTVRLWDADNGQELRVLRGHTNLVLAVAFSPDGKRLASASADGKARLWDLEMPREPFILDGRLGLFQAIRVGSFSPDGKRLATVSLDNTVRLWDLDKRQAGLLLKGQVSALPFDEKRLVVALAFSPEGKRLASATFDGTVRLWETEKEEEPFLLKGHADTASALAFTPDGRRLATGSHDGRVRLWDVERRVETLVLKGHTGPVTALSFSRDGTRLASASFDDTVRVWEAPKISTEAGPK